jgi:sulfur relay (sulfurtransferase) complex TusBCD TusD component (DsrE family)
VLAGGGADLIHANDGDPEEGHVAGKTLTIFLTAAPYAGEHASTAMRLARAALEAGHRVNLFASADGVYAFTVGHRAKGLPNAEAGFRQLIDQELHVQLCGSCLAICGLGPEHRLSGAEPSSMPGLFRLIRDSNALITLGS